MGEERIGNFGANRKIILKWILKKQCVVVSQVRVQWMNVLVELLVAQKAQYVLTR
jgi:hypothetical protein